MSVLPFDPTGYHPRSDLLRERVILITGAGQGIGRVAARCFAQHGASVILHGRASAKLEQLYDEIVAAGLAQPAILPLDFASATEREFDRLALAIETQLGRLDGILHNAVHLDALTSLENHTLDEWLRMLRVNLVAPAALNRACAPLLRAAPDAAVVLTAETHAEHPSAYWGAFAAAKSGLFILAKIQAEEWASHSNLRINTVIPGVIDSPSRARTHPGEAPGSRANAHSLMSTYLYLLGPDSSGTSGEVFRCQG